MMFSSKTSLGIEISSSRISFALLGETKGKLRLIKAGSANLPKGVMAGGSIVSPVELGRCLRKLLRSSGIYQRRASVSLTANPSLIQIVEIPAEMPENMGQFVRSEIRHSAILSGNDHCFDYYGLGKSSGKENDRMLVSAADNNKISVLLKALSIAGIEPVAVTPVILGWLQALYSKHVKRNYDANMLFAIADDTSITICVFSKGRLDFVRNVEIPIGLSQQEYMSNILNELNAVRQYYDIEIALFEDKKWKTIVEIDSEIVPLDQIQDFFGNTADDVCICSPSNAIEQISLSIGKSIKTVSITAVGLALGQFDKADMKIALNLIPEAFNKVKKVKKLSFAAACIGAAIMNFVLISNNLMGPRFAQAEKMVETTRENLDLAAVSELTCQKAEIEKQMSDITQRRDFMLVVSDQNRTCDWSKLLDVLIEKSSSDICITSLSQIDDHAVEIEGKVFQYKSAYAFAGLLTGSEFFESAVVADMHKDTRFKGLINYSIKCVIQSDRSIESDDR